MNKRWPQDWAELAHACRERKRKLTVEEPDPERMQREQHLLERVLPAKIWYVIQV